MEKERSKERRKKNMVKVFWEGLKGDRIEVGRTREGRRRLLEAKC